MTDLDVVLHQGCTAYAALPAEDAKYGLQFIDGLIYKILNEANIAAAENRTANNFIQLAGPSAITASNIADKFQAAINSLPKGWVVRADRYNQFKFAVSTEDYQIYGDYQLNTTFKGTNIDEEQRSNFMGYKVVPVAGIPKNTFYFAQMTNTTESNLWLGVNSVADTADGAIKMDRLFANSELWFVKGLMKLDINAPLPEEFIIHTPLTLADFAVDTAAQAAA
jgi:hypothetical protein